VVATDNLIDLLALDADCVTYCAAVSGREGGEVIAQISALLASGKNVVTPSYHALFHPPSLDHASKEQLEAACRQGNSSVLATGIAPGFATDILAVHAASMSELPTKVSVEERIPCGAYRVPGFFAMLGFGRTPEQDAEMYRPGSMVPVVTPPLRLLAQGLGLGLDEVHEHRDVAIADRHYSFDAGEIPAGTIASVRMGFDGIVDGQQRLHYSSIWSMPDEAVEDWQPAPRPETMSPRLKLSAALVVNPDGAPARTPGTGPTTPTRPRATRARRDRSIIQTSMATGLFPWGGPVTEGPVYLETATR
jgi:hypothetical protein